MSSSSTKRSLVPALLLAGLSGCSDSTGPDEGFVANVQVAPGHIHSFETEVTFTATFTLGVLEPALLNVTRSAL